MCAVNGFTWDDKNLLKKMNDATKHRGPDGTDIFTSDGISLGHNRLKIIDLSEAAKQPMKSHDGRYIIVFNGEIYNFAELREELSEYPYSSKSDTEVILAAYISWGAKCVERFNGIFAFAIWDTQESELFLSRDPIGVKPLYYFHHGDQFIFSSEIKAILEHAIPRILDQQACNNYFRLGYVPAPLTMFSNVYKFPPAHYGLFKNGSFETVRYWDSVPEPEKKSFEVLKKEVRVSVERAVEHQLISDRPVGVYLSGGIDSSVVLAAASKVHAHMDTFSVGFALTDAEEQEKFNADFDLARRTAHFFGSTHHEIRMTSEELIPLFEQSVWHMDEPNSNPTIIPTLKLASFAKEFVTAALGGDGGDELFGGYDRYRLSAIATIYQKYIPSFFRSLLGKVHPRLQKLNIPEGVERYMLFMAEKDESLSKVIAPYFFMPDVTKDFLSKAYFGTPNKTTSFESSFMYIDRTTWLVDDSLMRSDKTNMADGLEMRVPLLDKNLVELSDRVPLSYKLSSRQTKKILKEAFRDVLPEYLFTQPKRGWIAPAAKWLRHPHMQAYARTVLSGEYYEGTKDLFNWNEVQTMLDDHISKKCYNLNVLWALLTFQVWAKRYQVRLTA